MEQMEIVVAIIVGLITLVLLYFIFGRRSSRRTNVLLTGVCDSGKTRMFAQLVYGSFKQTHTSLKENRGEMTTDDKIDISVVDIPGHERLRSKYIEQFGSTARGIVFVIDCSTITKEIKDVAEYLYFILTDDTIFSGKIPLLIACNKQDLTFSKSASVVQSLLEKELNTVRRTRSATLQATDGTESARREIGKDSVDFNFSHLAHKVDFVECSNVDDLSPVKLWITSLFK